MTRAWGENLSGRIFSRLMVISEAERKNGLRVWHCRCDCGNLVDVGHKALKSGGTKSCGCFRKEVATINMTSHGHAKRGCKSRIYKVWAGMISRCQIISATGYENYGGRGISVCSRWHEFENFIADMGEPENKLMTIERIDNNGNYEPSNCRWATRQEQSRNKRNNHVIDHDGKSMNVSDWARHLGINRSTLIEALAKHPVDFALRERK